MSSALSVAPSVKVRQQLSLSEFAEQFEEVINENDRLNLEIVGLRSQLSGRLDSLLAAKEKLMRDEFDRKFQELQVEVKRERNKYAELMREVKKQLSSCICRANHR